MIRITGGEFRGRALVTPASQRTRPTQSKLRQALFNSLQTRVSGARVLDLFAGSGALGFEALSRGADFAVFVEQAKPVCRLIEKNAEALGVRDRVRILCVSVEECWSRLEGFGPFDIVLADPPYAPFTAPDAHLRQRLLDRPAWDRLLSPEGVFCVEWGDRQALPEGLPERFRFLVKIREKNYGDSVLTTFEKTEEAQP